MLWQVPRMWEGGRCVILGGGTSILRQFQVPDDIVQDVYAGQLMPQAYSPFLYPLHREHVIAVNVAYRFGDWVDVMFFGDDSTWNENRTLLLDWNGLIVTCADCCKDVGRVKYLLRDRRKSQGITTDPSMVAWNNNSGSSAINFAVHTGVKQILLFGFDMKLDDQNNQHWHKFYAKNKDTRAVTHTMMKHLRSFPQIAQDAQALGVEILNVNPDSAIDCFRKVNWEEALC